MKIETNNIPLSQMIETLRNQMEESIKNAKNKDLQFSIESIELELKVGISHDTTGKAGVSFWIINVEGEHQFSKESIHTFKLILKPMSRSNATIRVNDEDTSLLTRPNN
jgi:hypothetical protein